MGITIGTSVGVSIVSSVGEGGISVGTSVSGGTGVSVSGMGVSVGMAVGIGVDVFDGGICVGVGGIRVAVDVATGGMPCPRVLVGGIGVRVGGMNTVDVLELSGAGEKEGVGVAVGEDTY